MKAMICQPMNGFSKEEILEIRKPFVEMLEQNGIEVLDTLFDLPNGKNSPCHYLAKSIEAIAEADSVIFVPGWESARGCKIEFEIAKNYGKYIHILNMPKEEDG